ncbi:golgin subfamily A member 6-like protein 6 isoform X5 [Nerophis ophidion]|uniref:golgin subfamily A member 6-like protein 6 isoform X5 n=1 Tax=Nerophis ophidion TaxID=159077 RepID=UPI002ADF1C43|nr:golgin subfamily A member 6-like protein 6 isoform X5 [Nerophis ophidion]
MCERTGAKCEEELSKRKEEDNQLLDAVFKKHQVVLHIKDVQQVSAESQEEIPSKQQEWSSSVGQKELEAPSHIKEEEEELWKQLQSVGNHERGWRLRSESQTKEIRRNACH